MSDELRGYYPVQEFLHIECDCVPEYGPSHCHLCSGDGQPVEWPCRFAASMGAFAVGLVAVAKAEALRGAANDWTQGAWANTPRHADRITDRMKAAQYAGDWLRARALAVEQDGESNE